MKWREKANVNLIEEYDDGDYHIRKYANRLAISRLDNTRLTWEELQQVKHDIIGNTWAIELFPPQAEVVNLRHTRHLWFGEEITATVLQKCKHVEFSKV